jgi:hypothetical protein
MKSLLFLVGALLSVASAGLAQEPLEAPTVAVEIGDQLVIERPTLWQPGVLDGPSVLVHFIGGADGFPQFTAMADVESALDADAGPDDARDAVEEMFAAIAGDDEILEAGWTRIHDIDVHSSLSVRASVAGAIQRRRLMFVHDKVPYVLAWAHFAGRYEDVAELFEKCAASLKIGRGGSRIAAAPPAAH